MVLLINDSIFMVLSATLLIICKLRQLLSHTFQVFYISIRYAYFTLKNNISGAPVYYSTVNDQFSLATAKAYKKYLPIKLTLKKIQNYVLFIILY